MVLLFLSACSNQGDADHILPLAAQLITAPEGVPPRSAAGQSGITWLEPTGAAKNWQEISTARANVEQEIVAANQQLAGVDYARLALPDFITVTRQLQLDPNNFTGQLLSVEAFGTDKTNRRWTLYTWQGPEIPQCPDRTLVHRWVQVYALYDMDAKRVITLLATIHGEVHE